MKVSIKYKDGLKWKNFLVEEIIGQSIAYTISKSNKTIVAALIDDKDVPVFFLTNCKEQHSKYKEKGHTMMVDDLILLLGTETIPSIPLTNMIATVFPDARLELTEDIRVEEDEKQWW